MNIDLFITASNDSREYAEFLYKTCKLFESGKLSINYKYVEYIKCDNDPKGWTKVDTIDDIGHCSMNHGLAFNKALQYVESEYVVFCDVDIAMLYTGWDNVIVENLNDVDCFGFDENSRRYNKFPAVFLFAFK